MLCDSAAFKHNCVTRLVVDKVNDRSSLETFPRTRSPSVCNLADTTLLVNLPQEPTGHVKCSYAASDTRQVVGLPDSADGRAQEAMPAFRLKRPRQHYMRDVATCLDALAAGESYEARPSPVNMVASACPACFVCFGQCLFVMCICQVCSSKSSGLEAWECQAGVDCQAPAFRAQGSEPMSMA